jgi:broad specificity phosphatase PhoE
MIYLIRHGQTDWSLADKHTGLTDRPLTDEGKREAEKLRKQLAHLSFDKVFVSPLKRAYETCTICGFEKSAEVLPDLVEWDYGDYEGMTTAEIRKSDPDWSIFSKGAPGGESLADIEKRAKRVLAKVASIEGDVALFSSGHFLRALAVTYLGFPITSGRGLLLSTASLSILSREHGLPVISLWNQRPA